MPKKAYLVEHYDSNELKQKYLKSKDPVESGQTHLNLAHNLLTKELIYESSEKIRFIVEDILSTYKT